MSDKWGSFQKFMNDFSQLAKNPAQYAMQRMGIPQSMANDPDAIIQQWMNEGRLSQEQYNEARKTAGMIQNNPLFKQLLK